MKYPSIELTHLDNLWFQVTGTRCNIACAHCFNSSGPEATGFGFLTLERVREELSAAVELGVREVFFTGGEPFLHPQLVEMLRLALESAPTTVLTNGTLITERTADRLAEIERGSSYSLEIRVSLDGYTAEMNDAIRGAGVFRQAIGAIARLSARELLPLVTVVRTWADDDELAVLAGFVRTLWENGCVRPRIKVLPALPLGRELDHNGGAKDDAFLTEEMMAGFDRDLLMCSNSRLVTDRGVWVCPLLVEMPDARLGARLTEALPAYELRHHACVACYRYGTICGNVSADIEGPGAPLVT